MLFSEDQIVERHVGVGEYKGLEFLHVNARRIINEVPAGSRMGFRYTINPYRGCSHACTYCFARPTHEYLGLGIGEDFDRKLVVKVNAVDRLRAELRSPRWNGDLIAMGTNTDPYQHAEGRYHLTQRIIEVLGGMANPFSAKKIAGVKRSFHGRWPKRSCSLFQPSTAPGTVTVSMPVQVSRT